MTLMILLYGIVVGAFIMLAARFLDHALRTLGRPARWVWLLALAATAILPAVVLLAPSALPAEGMGGVAVPLEALYGLGQRSGPGTPEGGEVLAALDGSLRFLWLGASVLVLLTFMAAALRLRWRASRWVPKQAGGRQILVSDGTGPAVLGLLTPRIVLPSWALDMQEDELELILLHEEEHLRARDPALLAGAIALVALAPWNPALWWGLQRLRLAVEADCDNRVLARGIGRVRYGALLLGVASGSRRLFPLAPALVEGGGGFLERRLRMMKTGVRKKGILGGIAALMAGGAFLVLACETPTPPGLAEAEDPAGMVQAHNAQGTAQFHAQESGASEEITEGGGTARFLFRTQEETTAGSEGVLIRLDEGQGIGQPVIYLDGVRLEGGSAAMTEIDPRTIERVEVIKGSAARAVFGEEASNGVIQIYLKK